MELAGTVLGRGVAGEHAGEQIHGDGGSAMREEEEGDARGE